MDLRIIAGVLVVESQLSKQAKLQLLNYLQKEATKSQVKAFLLDGEIVQLDEQAEEIINDRFDVNESIVVAGGAIMAGAIAAALADQAYKVARLSWSKAHRACLKYDGNAKQQCVAKYKKAAILKQIQVLSSGKSKCNKSKEPDKCRKLIDSKISKLKEKANKIMTLN